MKKRKYFILMKEEGNHYKIKRSRILGLLEGICYDEPQKMGHNVRGALCRRKGESVNNTLFWVTTTNDRFKKAEKFIENHFPGLCEFDFDITRLYSDYYEKKES